VLDQLENSGQGLNLTVAVLEAIEKSSKAREDIFAEGWGIASTLEGQAVKVADAIAYVNHDILDAIRAGLITPRDLPAAARLHLGQTHRERIDALITGVVEGSWAATGEAPAAAPPEIRMVPSIAAAANELREFMFRRVYLVDRTRSEAERGKRVTIFLFRHFASHSADIESDYCLPGDPPERRAADYVGGMTDRYAIRLAAALGCEDAQGWRL
jgi:dGTPase